MTEDLTVKELRSALDGLPDDLPVRVEVEPGGRTERIDFIYRDAAGWPCLVLDGTRDARAPRGSTG